MLLFDGCHAEFQFNHWILPRTACFNISSQFLTQNLCKLNYRVLSVLGLSTAKSTSSVATQQLMSILWHTVLH
jgi:hypothetical protein